MNDYIEVAYGATTENIAVEQVLKSPMTSRSCPFGLIENNTSISYYCLDWWIDPDDSIRVYTYDGSGYCDQGIYNTGIVSQNANKYFHLVISKQSSLLEIFLNGNLISSRSTWTNGGPPLSLGAQFARIGTRTINGTPSQAWTGEIPITKIYNRALTPTEITQNYNALKSRFDL